MRVECDIFHAADPLWIAPISGRTAKRAVKQFHYSRTYPSVFLPFGVFERKRFRGVVCFGFGAASAIADPFGLEHGEVCELVRVALDGSQTNPTSKIVATALRLLHKRLPKIKVVVSFADSGQGHTGGIYQAMGWLFVGSQSHQYIRLHGNLVHPKTLHSRHGVGGQSIPWLRDHVDPMAERVAMPVKHKFIWFFDPQLKAEWAAKSLPYPKRASEVQIAAQRPIQVAGGGASPTLTL